MKQGEVNTRLIALLAIMAALVLALTYIRVFQTPVGGYIHLGDIAVYFAALAFGPLVGGVAGGVGTALADVIGGYPLFAIASLIVHGLQGYAAGRIGHGKTHWAPLTSAILAGSVILILGYFIAEAVFLGFGPAAALEEVPWNVIQEVVGAIGVAVYLAVRRAYPPIVRYSE
jgi:uncharacterized membrane protein